MKTSVALVGAACFTVTQALPGAEVRRAALVWDGVAAFGLATVSNAMDARVRRPAKAGDVALPAVFLHPLNQGRAQAAYPSVRTELAGGEPLFFLGLVGLSDGFDWKDEKNTPDGVRFTVVANGREILQRTVADAGWQPVAAALGVAVQGAVEMALSLADDAGPNGNASYDWALFGAPLVVALDGQPLPAGTAVAGTAGVLVVQVAGGTGRVIVEGLDGSGAAIAASQTSGPADPAAGLTFVRFDLGTFQECRGWRWRAEGVLQIATAWGGSWQPTAVIEHAGPTQAVYVAGDSLRVRVSVRNTGMGALLPEHDIAVACGGQRQPVGPVASDETTTVEFDLGPIGQAPADIPVRILGGDVRPTALAVARPPLWPPLPPLPAPQPPGGAGQGVEAVDLNADYLLLENAHCRWLVSKAGLGALAYVRAGAAWEAVGSVAPWAEVADSAGATQPLRFEGLAVAAEPGKTVLTATSASAAGLRCALRAELASGRPALQVELRLSAAPSTALRAFRGPAVHAGEHAGGMAKGIAFFPGLEYLEGDERSSSRRDLAPPLHERWVPHRFKVTLPLMLVETRDRGPVLGIAWDARQTWDGTNTAPGACFASPDFLTLQDSHLMQLLLPSVPDGIPESRRVADAPIMLAPGKPWVLMQFLVAGLPRPDATAALRWYDDLVGYPEAEAPPRSVEEEMALCRHGFMVTAWDAEKQQGRHVVGWDSANAPGFATLMLMDARTVATGTAREQLLERVELIGAKTVREQGAAGLASAACCHTMGWEFPYHWGHLPGALAGMRAAAYESLQRQEADGLWGFHPGKDHESLGQPGTRTMGICGRHAYLLAKYVAITGDPEVRAGLDRALAAMAQFRVPRGAQGWECPILEPDVLASAYAVRAYVWTAMATGDRKWLAEAELWARTGLPFQYVWDDGQHPGMRYASIPVFGSTFFTHTWIGLPVQWCGLVYAYGLQELQRLAPDDLWRRQVEGMVVSAMWQQWPMENRELAGTYPDSYGQWFTRRNGVFINPENIQLNLLAMKGLDPGLRSVAVALADRLVHVTAPCAVTAEAAADGVRLGLRYLPGQTVYVSLGGIAPGAGFAVDAGGKALARQDDLPPRALGWTYREALCTAVFGVACGTDGAAAVTVRGLVPAAPAQAVPATAWEFADGVEGWTGEHACRATAAAGALRVTVAGPDPYAISGPAWIDAATSPKLALRVRLSGGRQLGLFWRSSASPHWGPDKEVHADVPADNQWHEIEFPVTGHPLWTGRILQLRLDVEPADVGTGVALDVDWIRPR